MQLILCVVDHLDQGAVMIHGPGVNGGVIIKIGRGGSRKRTRVPGDLIGI